MQKDQIAQIRARLLQVIPSDPEQISRPGDRIQKRANRQPELAALCEYSQAQKLRRLVILPLPAWTEREARWADEALKKIADLSTRPGPEAALALACFGVLRADFETALALLDQPAEPPAIEKPAAQEVPKPAKGKSKKAPAPESAPAAPLASLDDIDDADLDDQTLADLDALRREVDGMKK